MSLILGPLGPLDDVEHDVRERGEPQVCVNCGAPLQSTRCDYCGTKYAPRPPKPRPDTATHSPQSTSFSGAPPIRPNPHTQGTTRR